MRDLVVVLMIFLATYRVTRLLITDTFPPIAIARTHVLNWLAPDIEWIQSHDGVGHWGAFGRAVRYLLCCPWCLSVYVGAGAVGLTLPFTSVPVPVWTWLGAATVTGFLARFDD